LVAIFIIARVTLREKERDAEKSARALVVVIIASLKEEGKRRGFEERDDENIFAFIYYIYIERERERDLHNTR